MSENIMRPRTIDALSGGEVVDHLGADLSTRDVGFTFPVPEEFRKQPEEVAPPRKNIPAGAVVDLAAGTFRFRN